MIFLLQLLAVFASSAFALIFLFLVIGPPVAAMTRGGSFTVKLWHGLALAFFASLAIWLAVSFGWVNLS